MNTLSKLTRVTAAFLWTFATLHSASVRADDTEIYVGRENEGVRPNVLFIMDTSGSMATLEDVGYEPYDHTKTYAGSCSSDRIYWDKGSDPNDVPSCSSDYWVKKSVFTCDFALTQGLQSTSGYAVVKAARWKTHSQAKKRRWDDLTTSSHDDWVECQADDGKHGVDGSSSKKYAANGSSGPWSSDKKDRINWDAQDSYTFFSANYMNWYHTSGGSQQMTRLAIVQDVANKLVDSVTGINIGLMRFDRYANGGYVDMAVEDVETSRATFKAKLNSYTAAGNTPLAETMYEAALYWRGESVYYGLSSSPGTSVPSSYNASKKYITPITESCQKNHIVYLTDGEPTSDTGADSKIKSLVGKSCSGNCLDELAEFLYQKDQLASLADRNIVVTHTVGFKTNQQLLSDAANKGGGKYYTADNYQQLQTALTKIFTDILSTTSLFTAPAVSVNAFNRLTHSDQVYFALFRPRTGTYWDGNVKRYKFDPTSGSGELVDVNGNPAVNPNTGEFYDSAQSWWSDSIDGNDVRKGGAAGEHKLPRKVFTYLGATKNLAAASNALSENNSNLTAAMLGIDPADTAYRETLLKWARGVDVDDDDSDGSRDDVRASMGDPLHSRPVVINFGSKQVLFVITNEGYFHAINTADGTEYYAFMPRELLGNIKELYEDAERTNRLYGLDGPLSFYIKGDDGDGKVQGSESLYAYFGMRRGGNNYYALDVTNIEEPAFKWVIEGGKGDFQELGQTWSKPVRTKIRVGSSEKDVLIFGGGYDPNQDNAGTRSEDGQGRALFIVDAETGARVWSGGPDASHTKTFAAMKYSIPSDVKVIDLNYDGFADQIYVGDMGGQLWRFDVANGKSGAALVSGGVIAEVSKDADSGNNRRFFYAPDISLNKDSMGKLYFAIAMGTGWRSHPLNEEVVDRFYVFHDYNVFAPPSGGYTKITESDLVDATDGDVTREEVEKADGWYITLKNSGEKVLAESLTIGQQIMFTTYEPGGESVACGPSAGIGRLYIVKVADAKAALDTDESGETSNSDRSVQLRRGGIPPSPTVLFPEEQTPSPDACLVVLVGPERPNVCPAGLVATQETFWRQSKDNAD